MNEHSPLRTFLRKKIRTCECSLRVKSNAAYLTHFLVVLQKVLRETETAIIRLSRRQFIFKVQGYPVMNL